MKTEILFGALSASKKLMISSLTVLAFVFGSASSLSAQTCVQNASATGLDSAPTIVSMTPTCQGPGVISAMTIDVTIGNACNFGWYSYKIIVNGVTIVTNQCDQNGFNLTPYLPITSIVLESADGNFIPSTITLAATLHVTYSASFCSGTPSAGAAYASTPVVCAGDSFDVDLSAQTTGLGLEYQWQSSPDNSTWTDMVNDTLLSVTTAQSSTNYYRCEVTCVASASTAISSPVQVQIGFCTPVSDTVCSYNSGPASENVIITGWQGTPLSDGIITFDYKGYLIQAANYNLTVTDILGNNYGTLLGGSVSCQESSDEIAISQAQIQALLAAGNGDLEFVLTSASGMGVFCPTPAGTNASFCATATLRAVTHIFPNDASINELVSPAANQCVLDSNLAVSLLNDGSSVLTSADIIWAVNGVIQDTINWTGSIPSYSSSTVALGVYTGGFSNYDTLKLWSALPNGVPDSNAVLDTLVQVVHESLSGTYVIDISGLGDFLSLNDALITLETFGMCGPVTFEVTDASYIEQLSINTSLIGGISSVNTILFTSQSGDPTVCKMVYYANGSTDNWVVKLENSQYVTFDKIGFASGTNYGRILYTPLAGNNHHITFQECRFEGAIQTASSSGFELAYIRGMDNTNWTFLNNTFSNGSQGLYFGDSSPNFGDSNSIIGNQFINQFSTSIYFRSQHNPVVKDNYLTSTPLLVSSAYAMNLSYFDGHGEITGNHVEGNSVWPRYGMYMGNLEGDPNDKFLIANNRIYVPGSNSYRGMYFYNAQNFDLTYNSIFKASSSAYTNMGVQLLSCDSVNVLNNLVQLDGLGFAMYISGNSSTVINSDYNAFSGIDANSYIGYYYGDTATTLVDWKALSSTDSNSLELSSMFTDTAALVVCTDSLYGKGIAIPGMNVDFEGDLRQDPPCIGADEFMPLALVGYPATMELCTGDTLVLSQYYFDVVVWDYIDTSNVLAITTTGSHNLSVFGACGTDTSFFVITPPLEANIGDTNLCEGTSAVLSTGIPNGTYTWSDGSTDSTVTVSSAQTISVQVISAFGCESADTAVITQSTNVNLADDSVSFCEGGNVILDANMLGSYLWSDGSTDQILNVTTSGTYVITVTEANCVSSDSTVVNEILNPVTSFTDTVTANTVTFTNTSLYADTYDWDFGDGNTSSQENPVHTYSPTSSNWTYTVILTATNDCSSTDYEMEVSSRPNSVMDLEFTNKISVYPNPTSGVFRVEIEQAEVGDLQIQILDLQGKVVYTRDVDSFQGDGNKIIDISQLSTGMYLVRISLNDSIALFKIEKN